MNNKALLAVGAFVTTLMLSASANAQLFRAYVSSMGNDANPCTLSQPCRLLPAALAAVAFGGEIWMLDSANYNTATFTINKSVSILAVPGAVGSVVALGGPAISIPGFDLTVSLRNLVIVPFPGGAGSDGVTMTGVFSPSTLTIENSLIANLPGYGVYVSGNNRLKIANTIIRNSGNYAVWLQDGAAAAISGTQMLGNAFGAISAESDTATTTTATVSDSVISGKGAGGSSAGVVATTTVAGGVTRISLTRCTIEGTSFALESGTSGVGSAVIAVSNSMITNNGYAWSLANPGSVISTLGNNHIADNANPPIGAPTATALQ